MQAELTRLSLGEKRAELLERRLSRGRDCDTMKRFRSDPAVLPQQQALQLLF